ncbi:DNA polymerase III subunit delta' C-terminal domain-containing protein [Thorsellia kenyensis]|uniref:DNA polymerase III subunit delta' n=1 Tax=Thorsellia kenyensis TaxID=1549888 RepID=A0ABV6C8Q2_9GAMM
MGYSMTPSMPWLISIYQTLIGMYANREGHHALLLSCAKGQGEDELFHTLASYLLCKECMIDSTSACGVCPSCLLMSAGNHPDYHTIAPEKDKKQIGIDIIRLMTEQLYQHANQGGAKIVQIVQLEAMTHAAMNALLKILEEPPEKTFFLLSTYAPDALLATIKSRCLNFPIATIDKQAALNWLKNEFLDIPEETLSIALKIALGAPLIAKSLLNEGFVAQRIHFMNDLHSAILANLPLSLLNYLTKENWLLHLDSLMSLVIDAMKIQSIKSSTSVIVEPGYIEDLIINSDMMPVIERLAEWDRHFLQALSQNGLHLRHLLLTNSGLNLELLMANFLLKWQQKKLELLTL